MIIFPYPKPTKCYGDTVIRRYGDIKLEWPSRDGIRQSQMPLRRAAALPRATFLQRKTSFPLVFCSLIRIFVHNISNVGQK